MDLLSQRLPRRGSADLQDRVAALEDYVEHLRQQTEYALDQAVLRLEELERKAQGRDQR